MYSIHKHFVYEKIMNIFWIPFAITFFTHRVFPLSVMLVVMLQNIDKFVYSSITTVHFTSFLLHTGLQYYWFILICNKCFGRVMSFYVYFIKYFKYERTHVRQ